MSTQTQIDRIKAAKTAIAAEIVKKGVAVPDGLTIDGYAALIAEIMLEISGNTTTTLNGLLKGNGTNVQVAERGKDYVHPDDLGNLDDIGGPATATELPASGTALTNNTIYHVTAAVGSYNFVAPTSGWAHGYFATGSSASVSFAGQFIGAAPTIEANKAYEFDVYDGIWAVQEVVTA